MSAAEYAKDKTILDEADLYRRIPPNQIVRDENQGILRPSSQAFEDSRDGTPMSVVLADVLSAAGRAPESVLIRLEGFALASITAGLARDCGQGVARDPTDDEPAHALVFGKKTGSVRGRLAKECRWVIEPEPLG